MPAFKIDTADLQKQAKRLEKIHRSALPVVIRGTLNNMAFDTKKRIADKAPKAFTIRNRGLFKALVPVDKADGFNVNNMKATTGIAKKQGLERVAERMEAQEYGGKLKSEIIPTDEARVGGNRSKKVKRPLYIDDIKDKIVRGATQHNLSKASTFVAKAWVAWRKGLFLRWQGKRGGDVLLQITSFRKTGGKPVIKTKVVYTIDKGRLVKIKSQPLVRPSAQWAGKKGKFHFEKNFQKKINQIRK